MHEKRREKLLDDDPLRAVYISKYKTPYDQFIKDIGLDKIFIHYWSTMQLHIYNNYCKKTYSKIAIDATGGVCKKIRKPNGELSGSIFLYDITVNDAASKKQFSVCNMLSERNDADSFAYWLRQWIRDGASAPKKITCDMSLALLSAIAKAFTTHPNITSYINMCYNTLFNKSTFRLNEIYIRCDVAHVIKSFTRLKSLKQEKTRTKKFFIRSLAKLLLCTDIAVAKDILLSIFVVAQS